MQFQLLIGMIYQHQILLIHYHPRSPKGTYNILGHTGVSGNWSLHSCLYTLKMTNLHGYGQVHV